MRRACSPWRSGRSLSSCKWSWDEAVTKLSLLEAFAFGGLRFRCLVGELEFGGIRIQLNGSGIGAGCLLIARCMEVGPTEHPPAFDVFWRALQAKIGRASCRERLV